MTRSKMLIFAFFVTAWSSIAFAGEGSEPCSLDFPRQELGQCAGELCDRVDFVAQRAFAVFEKPNATSKQVASLNRGDRLDANPVPLIQIQRPGMVRVYKTASAAQKKDRTQSCVYVSLSYAELGTFRVCQGKKTIVVGEVENPKLIDVLQKSEAQEWFKVQYQGKTGFVQRPSDCADGLDCFGLKIE